MLGVSRKRVSTPNTLLLGVVAFCILVAVGSILVSSTPIWMGLSFRPQRETGLLVIKRVFPGGPGELVGARAGDQLIAIGGAKERPLEITVADVKEENGEATQAGVRASMQRYERVAQAVKSGPLQLVLKDAQGQVRTVVLPMRSRPLSALPVDFWANLGFGLLATLICGWVWALRPRELATQLFALTGVSMLAFTTGWAVHSTVELAMNTTLLALARYANHIGAIAYGGAMIALFLGYPKRLVRLPLHLLMPLAILI